MDETSFKASLHKPESGGVWTCNLQEVSHCFIFFAADYRHALTSFSMYGPVLTSEYLGSGCLLLVLTLIRTCLIKNLCACSEADWGGLSHKFFEQFIELYKSLAWLQNKDNFNKRFKKTVALTRQWKHERSLFRWWEKWSSFTV